MAKLRMWDQILAKILTINHPDAVDAFNYIFGKICALMGDEYVNFALAFLGTDVPMQQGKGGGQGGEGGMAGSPSNQSGIPMSSSEAGARENMSY